jgi:hypothetical protein
MTEGEGSAKHGRDYQSETYFSAMGLREMATCSNMNVAQGEDPWSSRGAQRVGCNNTRLKVSEGGANLKAAVKQTYLGTSEVNGNHIYEDYNAFIVSGQMSRNAHLQLVSNEAFDVSLDGDSSYCSATCPGKKDCSWCDPPVLGSRDPVAGQNAGQQAGIHKRDGTHPFKVDNNSIRLSHLPFTNLVTLRDSGNPGF